MKVGLFGGSFDPVHLGHVALVKRVQEVLRLDTVIVFPANVSPFKQHSPPKAPGPHRLAMLELAFSSLKNIQISDIEIRRGGVSYTIETLRKFNHDFPEYQYYLILYEEGLPRIDEWKDIEELKQLATIVFGVTNITSDRQTGGPYQLVKIPKIEISSTEIRERLKNNLEIKELVDPKVLDYIQEHLLY